MSSKSGIRENLLNLPDGVLVEIISSLNARDRVALSQVSERMNTLIFDNKKVYRDLDFSEEGYLTPASAVTRFFEDAAKTKYIRKINLSTVYCTKPGEVLKTTSKATNLVEVNISGFRTEDFKELGIFLEPLKKLKKLTCDWPTGMKWDTPWNKHLKVPFGKLKYLSITLWDSEDKWTLIRALELCLELEELYLLQTYHPPRSRKGHFWHKAEVLMNLKRVVCCGCETGFFLPLIQDMLPDPLRWAKVWPQTNSLARTEYFYFEKNLEVAEELMAKVFLTYDMWQKNDYIGWYLRHDCLLKEVVRTSEHVNSANPCFLLDYCCSLRMEEAKLLLEDPRHQIQYLNLLHDIEPECDVHLLALIFPTLTKLVLSNIVRPEDMTLEEAPLQAGQKRKHAESQEPNESECSSTSFEKLVDNASYVQDLTLCGSPIGGFHRWDLAALYQITGWKNLKVLYLANVPITDGQFLIEIAKQCTNLERLRLEDLGPRRTCCYKDDLLEMLGHCHNLKDFSIQQDNVDGIADLFNALATVEKLKRARVESLGKKNGVGQLLVPIEHLTRSRNLVLLICEIQGMTQLAADKLTTMLQRLKEELKRPLFQFEIRRWHGAKEPSRNLELDFAHKDLILSQRFTDAIYRLHCV